jgi:hypothetical protein
LDQRRAGAEGDRAHRLAIGEQHEVLEEQAAKEEQAEAPATP